MYLYSAIVQGDGAVPSIISGINCLDDMNLDVIIVGSGIGGLCTAVRLLKNGFNVTILEKGSTIGGKVNIKESHGFRFDLTASILMTPHVYSEIFEYAGRDYKDYFESPYRFHLLRLHHHLLNLS